MQRLLGVVMKYLRLSHRKGPRFESCDALASFVLHHRRISIGHLILGLDIDLPFCIISPAVIYSDPARPVRRSRATPDEIMYRT